MLPPSFRSASYRPARPPRLRPARRSTSFAAVAALLAGACTGGDSGIPAGPPAAVLEKAPAATTAAGTARVAVASDVRELDGFLDLAAGTGTLTVRKGDGAGRTITVTAKPTDGSGPDPHDPFYALGLVGSATDIEPVGGRQVRGASALQIDVGFAPEGPGVEPFPGDVWLDSDGRIRRVTLPREPEADPPVTNRRGFPAVVTIDLFDFGVEIPAAAPAGPAGGTGPSSEERR